MITKKDILRVIIEHQVFAPSATAFAKSLGYGGGAPVLRLLNEEDSGKVKKSVDVIWQRIEDEFAVDSDGLYGLWRIIRIYDELRPYFDDYVKAVVCLCKLDQDDMPEDLSHDHYFDLKTLSASEPDVFFDLIAYIYLKGVRCDVYQKGKFVSVLQGLIEGLSDILDVHFAESNVEGVKVAERVKNETYIEHHIRENMYGAITALGFVLMAYVAPEKWMAAIMKGGCIFDWGELSYWTEPDAELGMGQSLWCFVAMTDTPDRGFYNVFKMSVADSDGGLKVDDVMRVYYLENAEDKHGMTVSTLPKMYLEKEYKVRTYKVEVGESDLVIEQDDVCPFCFPRKLKRVHFGSRARHNERLWVKAIERFEDEDNFASFRKAIARETGIELLDLTSEYEIKDVFVGRSSIIVKLYVGADNAVRLYEIDRDKYSQLKHVSPDDDIFVCRHAGDDTVYIEWTSPGLCVPLTEFSI